MNQVNPIQIRVSAAALRAVMEKYGGVAACAEAAGITRATIYLWLEGRRSPRLQEWCQLMEVLGEDLVPFVERVDGI